MLLHYLITVVVLQNAVEYNNIYGLMSASYTLLKLRDSNLIIST
jgi:hypothetical protein